MNELINVLMNNPDGAYDFICNNYHNMSKNELKDVVKELLYAIYDNVSRDEHNKVLYDVALELTSDYED